MSSLYSFLIFVIFLFWLIIVIIIINLHSFLRAALFHSTPPLQRKRHNHWDSISVSQFPSLYLFVIWFNNFSWFISIFVSFNYGSHHPNSVFLSDFVSVFCNLGTFCVTQQCYFYWINEKVWGFDVIWLRGKCCLWQQIKRAYLN